MIARSEHGEGVHPRDKPGYRVEADTNLDDYNGSDAQRALAELSSIEPADIDPKRAEVL